MIAAGGSDGLEWEGERSQRRRRGAHLAAHQGQFDRRRHQRNPAQRGGQAHSRPARRLNREMRQWHSYSERRTRHAARQRQRFPGRARAGGASAHAARQPRRRRLRSRALWRAIRRTGLQRHAGARGATAASGWARWRPGIIGEALGRTLAPRPSSPPRCSPPGAEARRLAKRNRQTWLPRIAAAEAVIALAVDEHRATGRRRSPPRRRATAAAVASTAQDASCSTAMWPTL